MLPKSSNASVSSELMQQDHHFYFNRQTQQECLAALNALSMEKEKFGHFIVEDFTNGNFIVVIKLALGILTNSAALKAAQDLIEIPDIDQKRAFFLNRLKVALTEAEDRELLDIFLILSESIYHEAVKFIRLSVRATEFDGIALSPSDVQAVAFTIRQCEHLNAVNLDGCSIDDRKMNVLSRAVIQSDTKIDEFSLSFNDLTVGGMSPLAKVTSHCGTKSLILVGCDLTLEHIECFQENAGGTKFEAIDVSHNERLNPEAFKKIGTMLQDCAQKLTVRWNDMSKEKLRRLRQGLAGKKIQSFNVGNNSEMPPDGWKEVGKVVQHHKVRELHGESSKFNNEKLLELHQGMGNAEVT